MKQTNLIFRFTKKSEYCELSDEKPVNTFIPGQAIKLAELVARFERGQRLNVHGNPMNIFYSTDEQANANSETFDSAPPDDIHDITDVEEYYRAHQQHLKEYKEKKAKTKQAPVKEAQQVEPPTPPNDTPPAE